MSNASSRFRPATDRDDADEWLLEAARRAGHALPDRERPAGTSSWRILLSAGVPEEEVLRLACAASGTDAADFSQLSPSLSSALPHGVALKHRVAPLGVHRGTLGVATSNPRNPALERELAFAARQRVRLHAASPTDIIRAQGVVYGTVYGTKADGGAFAGLFAPAPASIDQPVASAPAPSPAPPAPRQPPAPRRSLPMTMPVDDDAGAVDIGIIERADDVGIIERAREPERDVARATVRDTPAPAARVTPPAPAPAMPDLTTRLLAAACAERASDAVLEPTRDGGFLVRLCVDGLLNDRFRIAEAHAARVVHTLKLRAGLNADEMMRPQSGRMTLDAPDGPVSIRISTDPLGDLRERVVLRLFPAGGLLGIAGLGLPLADQRRFAELLATASGLLVVAGPEGSGRTTTMYAAAQALAERGRRVTTVEELIEYPLPGVEQLQLHESPHATRADAVRAALAGESEVLIVGEPLDVGTLDRCAAEHAHARLVIAPLDAPDIPSTLGRLMEMHPDRARLAASLGGIVAQRLVRRLCEACTVPQPVSELPEQQQRLLQGRPTVRVHRPVGCAACRTTGYLGRTAIAEVVPVTPALRAAIARGATQAELAQVAREGGLPALWEAGVERVCEGVTSLAELLDTAPVRGAPQEDIDELLVQLLGTTHMQPEPHEAATHAAAAEEGAALRVLLVDDDGDARRALAQRLTEAGLQVTQAADGSTALAYAKRLRPDLVLTEVALPGLDAVGLLGALREMEAPPVVVVHTAQEDDALHAWLLECGARVVLRRDIATAELARRLRWMVRG